MANTTLNILLFLVLSGPLLAAEKATYFPRASARCEFILPRGSRLFSKPTLETALVNLQKALNKANYCEQAWYIVGAGTVKENGDIIADPGWSLEEELSGKTLDSSIVAITRMEQISESGDALVGDNRWSLDPPRRRISTFYDYINALLAKAPRARYRTFVLAITSKHGIYQTDRTSYTPLILEKLFVGGKRMPPTSAFRFFPYESVSFHCLALVYEFEKANTHGDVLFVKNSGLDGRQHLIRAGIWQALKLDEDDQVRRLVRMLKD